MNVSQTMRLILAVIFLVASFGFADTDTSEVYDNVTMTVSVTNVGPIVAGVLLEDNDTSPANELDLVAGATNKVWCNATINDESGSGDINQTSLNVTIWHIINATAKAADPDNNNHHYSNGSASEATTDCQWESVNSTAYKVGCAFNVSYYADSGSWNCTVVVKDNAGPAGANGTDNSTMNTFLGIRVLNTTLNFGTVGLGANSSQPLYTTVQNTCNQAVDLKLWEANWSGNLTCNGVGSTNISTQNYLAYNMTRDLITIHNSTRLNVSSTTDKIDISLNWQQSTTNSTNNTYWVLMVPRAGISGSCVGIIQYQAVAG